MHIYSIEKKLKNEYEAHSQLYDNIKLLVVFSQAKKNWTIYPFFKKKVIVKSRVMEKEMATHSSILAWRIPTDRGAWCTTVRGTAKSQT